MQSSMLKSYLTGLILGDGYIDKGIAKRGFRIKSTHKDFICRIYEDLSSATDFTIFVNSFPESIGKDGTHHKEYWELSIRAHPYFAKIYHWFYDDFRNRVITKNALDALDWNGWANWYMSDGYITKIGKESEDGIIRDRRVELSTDRYSLSGVEYLSKYISEEIGYKTSVIKRGKAYRLRLSLLSADDFFLNISPFVVDSFRYKLDLAYDYKPSWMSNQYYELMKTVQSAGPRNSG